MDSLPRYDVGTKHGQLMLACTGVDEPNYGRMLFKVLLTLDGNDITKQYFGEWNFINFNLNGYHPFSEDGSWFYVPKETDHFLICLNNLRKIALPVLLLSAATFIKNFFWNDRLIVLSSDCIIVWDLKRERFLKSDIDSKERRYRDIVIKQEGKLTAILNNETEREIELTD